MKNFITNSDTKTLKERLLELIKKSEELKFLVGFFYFSGIRELYEGLVGNPNVIIKVLVGLNVDKFNRRLIEYAERDEQLSNDEITSKFLQSVKNSLNSEEFDTEEFYKQFKYFVNLIRDDKLIIRKTLHPNHAKIYLFKLKEDQVARDRLFITGSSNLTKEGLITQEEFNVEISDYGCQDTEEYFDEHWQEAVKITEVDEIKKKLIDIIEKDSIVREITPFEAFVLTMKTYLDSFEQKEHSQSLIKILEDNGYTTYQYQLDAIKQALAIIEKYNGVIIADVVGLGKTIVACAVARELKKGGIVICPPSIVGDDYEKSGWKKYIKEFGLSGYDWKIFSLGKLEDIAEFVNRIKDIEVVIIDEAHRFRNQDTKSYESLKNICRNKIVILITATPFNNRPGDILSLLKFFITPKKSTITLENNLEDKFSKFKTDFDRLSCITKYWNSSDKSKIEKAESSYFSLFGELPIELIKVKKHSQRLAKEIRDVIEPVTIRRNRLDLQNNPLYKEEVKLLSKVADPKEWFFELTKEQSEFYDQVIKTYFGDPDEGGLFNGAIYRPFVYEVEQEKIEEENSSDKEDFRFKQQQCNLFDFMRRLMVKRFESSFGSFQQSIKNFKKITTHALEFIEKTNKYILDRSLLEKIYNEDIETIEEKLIEFADNLIKGEKPKNHHIYYLNKFTYRDRFIADIKADLALFDTILDELSSLDLVDNDPKTDCLLKNIKDVLEQKPKKGEPPRKLIIFSEYLDTVKYLEPTLRKNFGDKLLVVVRDLSTKKIEEINENFDASVKYQKNQYDILLSSDRISEGFNLNRAGMVINYDIPWNPVRVIQRVGRINRISKKVFEELYIVNFFPTEKGSELVKSREIAGNKMFLIHNTLGEDAKIFDLDEEPKPSRLFEKIQQNPEKLEEASFYTKVLKEFLEIKKENPQLIEDLKNYPPRIKVAKKSNENELLVFFKKGRLYIQGVNYSKSKDQKIYQITFEEVYDKVKCEPDEKRIDLSASFWEYYEGIKIFREKYKISKSELSIEQKAFNNLQSLINYSKSNKREDLLPHLDFLRTLREDIVDYGTLSDYTLRRISNLDPRKQEKLIEEINSLKEELGENYLQKEKERQKDLSKEIIIAIENQKL